MEVVVFGPGYGESIALHVGKGRWIIVDSCVDEQDEPRALSYLEDLGVETGEAVDLVVATHWHDDHVRGLARVVQACRSATFCCSAALRESEFVAMLRAFSKRAMRRDASGTRELYGIVNELQGRGCVAKTVRAGQRVYRRGGTEVWALSPDDLTMGMHLQAIGNLLPRDFETWRSCPAIHPNAASVALWVRSGDGVVLLGADLERRGWEGIVGSEERPSEPASMFKVPHHGSSNAHVPDVWRVMVEKDCFAVVVPWRGGGRALPTRAQAEDILRETRHSFITSLAGRSVRPRRRSDQAVGRILRRSASKFRRSFVSSGAVRLRRRLHSGEPWQVELFDGACPLSDLIQHGN